MIRHLAIFLAKIYFIIFYKLKAYHTENIPQGAAILAPNHNSFFDPPVVGVTCPQEVHFLARESLFKSSIFGWLIRKLNTHPVKKGRENFFAFKKALEILQNNQKIVLFPEGRRSADGNLQKGELGVSLLVLKAHVPVVPIYIHGTYEGWNVHQSKPSFKGEIACVYGKALDFSHLYEDPRNKKEIQEIISNRVMEEIANLKKWYLENKMNSEQSSEG